MATDFRMQGGVDATSIARLAQEQAIRQEQLSQQAEQGKANDILTAAKAASDEMVRAQAIHARASAVERRYEAWLAKVDSVKV